MRIEETDSFEIEEEDALEKDEEVEYVGFHESVLRQDPKFQRLGEGKKRSRLLKKAIRRDLWEQKKDRDIDGYLRRSFVIPEGMTAEEATREMIKKDAEAYKEGVNLPP